MFRIILLWSFGSGVKVQNKVQIASCIWRTTNTIITSIFIRFLNDTQLLYQLVTMIVKIIRNNNILLCTNGTWFEGYCTIVRRTTIKVTTRKFYYLSYVCCHEKEVQIFHVKICDFMRLKTQKCNIVKIMLFFSPFNVTISLTFNNKHSNRILW